MKKMLNIILCILWISITSTVFVWMTDTSINQWEWWAQLISYTIIINIHSYIVNKLTNKII